MRKVIVVILAVLTLTVGMAVPAMAANPITVVITATGAYITMTQTQLTWTLNDIDGDGVTPKGLIRPNDIYYANPTGSNGDGTPPSATVLSTECYFDLVTTGSTINLDLTVNCGNFTGGGANMTNGGGTHGAAAYGGYAWGEGATYGTIGVGNRVIMEETGSLAMKEDLTPSASWHWGADIETQTGDWSSGVSSTTSMVLTATAHPP